MCGVVEYYWALNFSVPCPSWKRSSYCKLTCRQSRICPACCFCKDDIFPSKHTLSSFLSITLLYKEQQKLKGRSDCCTHWIALHGLIWDNWCKNLDFFYIWKHQIKMETILCVCVFFKWLQSVYKWSAFWSLWSSKCFFDFEMGKIHVFALMWLPRRTLYLS